MSREGTRDKKAVDVGAAAPDGAVIRMLDGAHVIVRAPDGAAHHGQHDHKECLQCYAHLMQKGAPDGADGVEGLAFRLDRATKGEVPGEELDPHELEAIARDAIDTCKRLRQERDEQVKQLQEQVTGLNDRLAAQREVEGAASLEWANVVADDIDRLRAGPQPEPVAPHDWYRPRQNGQRRCAKCGKWEAAETGPCAPQPAAGEPPDWYSRVPKECRFTASLDGGIVQDDDGPWVIRSDIDRALAAGEPPAGWRPDYQTIVQAVARGWCHEANAKKTMDPVLAMAIAHEVFAALAAAPQRTGAPDEKNLAVGHHVLQHAADGSRSQSAEVPSTCKACSHPLQKDSDGPTHFCPNPDCKRFMRPASGKEVAFQKYERMLEESLLRYGSCVTDECQNALRGGNNPCTCGWQDLKEQLTKENT